MHWRTAKAATDQPASEGKVSLAEEARKKAETALEVLKKEKEEREKQEKQKKRKQKRKKKRKKNKRKGKTGQAKEEEKKETEKEKEKEKEQTDEQKQSDRGLILQVLHEIRQPGCLALPQSPMLSTATPSSRQPAMSRQHQMLPLPQPHMLAQPIPR